MITIIKLFLTCLVGIIGFNTLTYDKNNDNVDIGINILNNYNVVEKEEKHEQEEVIQIEEDFEISETIEIEETIEPEIEKPQQEIIEEPKQEVEESQKEIEEESEEIIEEELDVIETIVGKMTGYGPDCYGCTTNRTASGYYVGEGNIYYNDEDYGKIRIVSADSKYPFGSIVRISNLTFQSEPIIAIVLDRGVAIGLDKNIQFDLLFVKENDALVVGIQKNVSFEILRLGY